jgi:hypothetical protein
MFQHRSREFDPRLAAVAGHLRTIERELGRVGQSAGRRTATRATTAGNQIVDAIVPILSEIVDRFGRGQRWPSMRQLALGTKPSKSVASSAATR